MSHSRLRYFPLWLCIGLLGCAVLVYACLMPSPPQAGIPFYDKWVHVLAYVVLGAWFGAILHGYHVRVFFGLLAFGLLIEWLQSLTGYRSAEALDVVADTIGIALGLLLARIGLMGWLNYIDGHVFPARNQS